MTNKEFFIQTWQSEMKPTLNAIKALPADTSKWNYQCDEKARCTSAILGHMLPHAEVMCNAADTFVADEHAMPEHFNSVEDCAAYFIKWANLLVKKLNTMHDKTWDEKIIDFNVDGSTYYQFTVSATFWMLLKDIIHHRGQLSTYYRHMGVRNPNIYGPTAEDMEEMMATKN